MDVKKYIKRIPLAVYLYFMMRSALKIIKTAFTVIFYSIVHRKNLVSFPIIKNMERNVFKEAMKSRPGEYNMAVGASLSFYVDYITTVLSESAREPHKLVWHEDLVPPEIIHALGLIPLMVEAPAIISPIISPDATHQYIDVMENAGYPGDICTLPKTTLGMILEDMFPPPRALVSSNSPCDGGMAYFLPIEQKTKAPIFRLDLPYNVYEPRAKEYCLKEVWRLIHFLEGVAGRKLDMDRLREVCEIRNRMTGLSADIWELMRGKPSPLGGDVLFLSHATFQAAPGTLLGERTLKNVLDVAKAMHAQGRGPIVDEKYRAVLWNPPTAMFPLAWHWLENTYKTVVVMDMLSYHGQSFIDTSTEETMMRDLTTIISAGPMARHTRGPADFFFGDLFRIYEEFQCDIIIMAAHQNCKNTRALMGMLRDYCRKDGIPLMVIDYDLCDARVVSPDGIKKQVSDFMETVMINY